MKLASIIFSLWFILQNNALAQDNYEQQRAELLEIMQIIEDGLNNKNITSIEPYIHDNTVMVFQDATVATGFQQINAYFERTLGAGDSLISTMTAKAKVGAPAQFPSENIAVAYGYLDTDYILRAGKTISLNTVWTTTVVRESENWTIATLHFSNNLFDNPILSARKMFQWIFAAIGLLAGILLMWLLTRWRSRNRRSMSNK